jgi:hypothetical protein
MLAAYKGDRGVRQARKHMTWYAKGFYGAAELRGQLCRIETAAEGVALIDRTIAQIERHEAEFGAIGPELEQPNEPINEPILV